MRKQWVLGVLVSNILAAAPGCGGADGLEGNGMLEVWPTNVNLAMTDDGMKFSAPIGASGGVQLVWVTKNTTHPRFKIANKTDSSAQVTADFAGADDLLVSAGNGAAARGGNAGAGTAGAAAGGETAAGLTASGRTAVTPSAVGTKTTSPMSEE